ncbi:MAG: metallophosphoesterase [Candidatus Omnitrophota bacterium]
MSIPNDNVNSVTWLHLSDLHIGNPSTEWKANRILQKLQDDFKQVQAEHGLKPDLIFFTGDAVWGHTEKEGKPIIEQYKEAAEFFDDVRKCFTPEVPKENFFIVPGNHDVNRSKRAETIRLYLGALENEERGKINAKLSELIRVKGEIWQEFMERLADYRQFLKDNGYIHCLTDPDRIVYSAQRNIHGIEIGIAGLNSAWSSHRDGEKGKLRLAGEWQINTLSDPLGSAHIKIALMHHPFNWFNSAEDPSVKIKMENYFNLFLHGHEHLVWVESVEKGITRISAGACYGDTIEEMGYNFTRISIEGTKLSGNVYLREYKKLGEAWIPGIIPGKTDGSGIWKFEKQINAQIETVNKVESPAYPSDSSESRGVFGRKELIEQISKALNKVPIAAVYGMPGIGKSKVIDEVKRSPQHKDKEHIMLSVTKEMTLDDLFRQLARAIGCRDKVSQAKFTGFFGKYDFSILKAYVEYIRPALIHLVDAHYLFEDYKIKDTGILEFLLAIPRYYEKTKIILESRISLRDVLPKDACSAFRIDGIDRNGMRDYFRSPFKDESSIGWELDEDAANFLFVFLGGKNKSQDAHPLSMMLLANVAHGLRQRPEDVMRGYNRHRFEEKLETVLFFDLYKNVLSGAEQRMLRLCALYRDGIPDLHAGPLCKTVGDDRAISRLMGRCLLTPDFHEEWYFLHTIITELTLRQIDKNSEEFYTDHEIIANEWLARVKIGGGSQNLANIRAANEAFHHLTEAENYSRLYELSEKLLRKDVVSRLDQLTKKLSKIGNFKDDRHVLELLVKLEPREARYHRFLGETLEKLEGSGNDDALMHYQEAYRLSPTHHSNLSNLGNCLMARNNHQEFIKLIEGFDEETFRKSTNEYSLSIYSRCLEQVSREDAASKIRQREITAGSRNPVFYNDEANYLLRRERYDDALAIIKQAEDRQCSDKYILSVKASVLEAKGDEESASRLRRHQIDAGSRNAAFYNAEANFLLRKERYDDALAIIKQAEDRQCASGFTVSIKASVLEAKGDEGGASRLRRQYIDAGSRDPVFYNAEANYLLRKEKYDEALEFIKKAEDRRCANEYILSVKASVLEAKGDEGGASRLRRQRIDAGSRHPAFYNDEANYLRRKERYEEALSIIEKEEQGKFSDEYTKTIKERILREKERKQK